MILIPDTGKVFYKGRDDLKHHQITAAILAAVSGICLMAVHASAAEQTESGVTLTVTADKSDYNTDEQIRIAVSLANNSGSDLTDISIKNSIPPHYRLADGSDGVLRTTYIQAGNSISAELILEPEPVVTTTVETAAPAAAAESSETVQTTPETEASQTQATQNITAAQQVFSLSTLLLILGAAAGIAGAVCILIKKRKSKTLAVILCIGAAGAFCPDADVSAAEAETKTFSVSEEFSVAGEPLALTAAVTFSMEAEDMQAAVAAYYEDNSEQVISVEKADEKADVYTESEALRLMAERGFTDYPLTYDYDMDGTYTDEAEASPDSVAKHPMYQTYYVGEDNSVWTILIVGKMIAANPVSYNLESDLDVQILVSETETLTSYTEMGNQFYTTIPKESAVLLKVVDQITSKTLNTLTFEEVINQ